MGPPVRSCAQHADYIKHGNGVAQGWNAGLEDWEGLAIGFVSQRRACQKNNIITPHIHTWYMMLYV